MRQTGLIAGRLLLGGVFVYAAYTKLAQHWTLFAFSINSYGLLPEWALKPVAIGLPWLELVLGLLLVVGVGLRYAATAASVLLLMFFGVMLRAYLQGLDINCGCFGLGEPLSAKTLVRDGALLGVSLAVTAVVFLNEARRKRHPETNSLPNPQGTA
jgi:uncharacterized membrane protein YphA (DoxX/SURF4 family)